VEFKPARGDRTAAAEGDTFYVIRETQATNHGKISPPFSVNSLKLPSKIVISPRIISMVVLVDGCLAVGGKSTDIAMVERDPGGHRHITVVLCSNFQSRENI